MRKPRHEPIDYSTWTLEQFTEELKTKQEYLDYFEKFDPNSIDAFIDEYAPKKYQMFQNQESYKSGTEYFKSRFINLADEYIDMILQKKLFNLQCEWRAGLIQLPLVRICKDFEYWSRHIRACPFIPIVTPEEIDLCISFLKEEYDEYADAIIIGNKWQYYELFKYGESQEEDNNEDAEEVSTTSMPPLYQYFDLYQNTAGLINLPDVRGEKEDMYLGIYRHIKLREKENLALTTPQVVEPTEPVVHTPYRHRLFWGSENIKAFVEAVENKETKEAHAYYYDNFQLDQDYEFEECLMYLRDFKEPFPIEAHEDWREAVRLVLLRQTQLKAAEMLPYVYETYLMEFDEPYNFKNIMADKIARHKFDPNDVHYQCAESYKDCIYIGRKALSDHDDEDYL